MTSAPVRLSSRRLTGAITAGLLSTSYALVAASGPASGSGPETTAAAVLGQFGGIRDIGPLGTTSVALIGIRNSTANTGELWRSDGTAAGTQRISVISTEGGYVADFVTLDARRSVFTSPTDGHGTEL